MKNFKPRNLDHVVLPVADLESARSSFNALGFNVAPDADHSFGSQNACVFFKDGTFIEPLAIGHRETVEEAMREGNNFLRRDDAYRFRHGDNGFSYLVFGDKDPQAQLASISDAGYECGEIIIVERPGVKVHIACVMEQRSADFTCFFCERPDGPPKFAEELCNHLNGAKGISQVVLYEHLPEDFQYYLQFAANQREVRAHSFGMELTLQNAKLDVLNKDGMKAYYGVDELPAGRGLRAMAFDVKVDRLETARNFLNKEAISTRQVGNRLIVDAHDGQGAIIAFVEA